MTLRYTTPGVYVERLDADPQRIRLRRTDVAGFVGLAPRGPLNFPVKVESWRQFVSTFGDIVQDAYLGYAVRGYFENGGRRCWVVRAGNRDGAVTARVQLRVEGYGAVALAASSPGAWGNALTVTASWNHDRVTALVVRGNDERTQRIELLDAGTAEPVHGNLLGVADAALPEAQEQPLVVPVPVDTRLPLRDLGARTRAVAIASGSDGAGALGLEHLLGDYEDRSPTGLAALERVDGVAFVAMPDLMIGQDPRTTPSPPAVFGKDQIIEAHSALIASCQRCGDRMALLDLPPGLSPSDAAAYPGSLTRLSTGAVYYPWILVDDPLRLTGLVRSVPPSGHVAGLFARVDRHRGVHQPPANQPLEGARDVARSLSASMHGDLNEAGVNAIRAVPGRGILVLGARTLDRDVRWRYVNIRRLFFMIEEALDEQLQWLVFEPNNPQLWREVQRVVGGFLERLYRLGVLDGATSEDAYTVRCDASTNPPWETELGRVACVIGLQPPYPAEFVIVRLGLTRDGVEIEERESRNV
jgi:Bacteriophage tail sheath protein